MVKGKGGGNAKRRLASGALGSFHRGLIVDNKKGNEAASSELLKVIAENF